MKEIVAAKMTDEKKLIVDIVDSIKDEIIDVGHAIWSFAEISREEYKSARYLIDIFKKNNFKVTQGIGGYPTSFVAEYNIGEGGYTIRLLAEYDALPEIGHGCGHNLFAAGAYGAAITMKKLAEKIGMPLNIKVFGTPSEEDAGSKPYFAKQGIFDGVDCFMGFHPLEFNGVLYSRHNAIVSKDYRFYGKSSHAGAEPHLGISALDAVELMNVAVNYLREHVTPDVRMHYIITNGGLRANVVPDFASSNYCIRAQEQENMNDVSNRIDRIAQGIAYAIGCRVEIEENFRYSNTVLNRPYVEMAYSNLLMLGGPKFTDEEQEKIKSMGLEKGLLERIEPLNEIEGVYAASTDEGDVSWQGPWIRISTSCLADETPGHNTLVTEQSDMSTGRKGIIQMIKICCCTLYDAVSNEDNMARMKEDYKKRIEGKKYYRSIFPYPSEKIFPNMLGLYIENSEKSYKININPKDTILCPNKNNIKILIYQKGNLLGKAEVEKYDKNVEIFIEKEKLDSEHKLIIKYSLDEEEFLLGYYNI